MVAEADLVGHHNPLLAGHDTEVGNIGLGSNLGHCICRTLHLLHSPITDTIAEATG